MKIIRLILILALLTALWASVKAQETPGEWRVNNNPCFTNTDKWYTR